MGNRGPKKGHGGRPPKSKPANNPVTQLHRLKKRELRARQHGHLKKVRKIKTEIAVLEKALKNFPGFVESLANKAEYTNQATYCFDDKVKREFLAIRDKIESNLEVGEPKK